jgi:hypothetical protein
METYLPEVICILINPSAWEIQQFTKLLLGFHAYLEALLQNSMCISDILQEHDGPRANV